jgi:hypothetical protein
MVDESSNRRQDRLDFLERGSRRDVKLLPAAFQQ